jgi:hypothetical protein
MELQLRRGVHLGVVHGATRQLVDLFRAQFLLRQQCAGDPLDFIPMSPESAFMSGVVAAFSHRPQSAGSWSSSSAINSI